MNTPRTDSSDKPVPLLEQHSQLVDSRQSPTLEQFQDATSTWKDIFSSVIGLGAMFYAVGFVISTTRLIAFGVNDFSLLKARYIAAGVLFIMLTAFTIYPAYIVLLNLLRWLILKLLPRLEQLPRPVSTLAKFLSRFLHRDETPALQVQENRLLSRMGLRQVWQTGRKATDELAVNMSRAFAIFLAFTFFSMLILLLLARPGLFTGGKDVLGVAESIWQFISSNLIWYLIWYISCWIIALVFALVLPWNWQLGNLSRLFWGTTGILLIALLMIPIYAQQIYPQISPAFGGGKPATVELVTDDKSAVTLSQLVPMQPRASDQPATSLPVELLDENDTAYFLLVTESAVPPLKPETHAVKVEKDLVQGIVYVTP
jgi:hypothetical protein